MQPNKKSFFTFLPFYFSTSRESGASHLVLVLVTATIMTLLAFSIQIITFLQTRQSAGSVQSKAAYFAAEGAMFETIQHLRDDLDWPPSFPFTDTYPIGTAAIDRLITEDNGLLTIQINAGNTGSKRKLVSHFRRQSQETPPLDVILVIDRSGSMAFRRDPTKPRGIEAAKDAVHAFLDALEGSQVPSHVGLVSYSRDANLDQPLTDLYDDIRDQVDAIEAGGSTNIGHAVNLAYQELDDNARNGSVKVIVVLSDGVAQYATPDSACYNRGGGSLCRSDACINPGSGFSPDDQGNCCSQDAIAQAATAKTGPRDYLVFSVSLGSNYTNSACGDVDRTIQLGRLTMLRLSSEAPGQSLPDDGQPLTYYKETDDTEELSAIFSDIASSISAPEFFQYAETEPDPDIE